MSEKAEELNTKQLFDLRTLCMEFGWSSMGDPAVWLRHRLEGESALRADLERERAAAALVLETSAREVARLRDRIANDSLAIERLEGKWCVEVVDDCPHDEKTWVCCSDCHATAIRERDALKAALERLSRQAEAVALKRPHDGSQLDEDLEGLLLSARAALAPPAEVPMKTRPFSELRAAMSPEAQAQARARTAAILAGEPCPVCAAKGWIHYDQYTPCLLPSNTASSPPPAKLARRRCERGWRK